MNANIEILYGSLRVLVVDDHMLMRNMINQNLRSIGFKEVESASNGEEAWKEINRSLEVNKPYDIIFLDWHMPAMEGIEVLQLARNNEKMSATAIVMLTAEQEQKNIMRAIENGATSYLVKPVSRDALEKNLKKVTDWLIKKNPNLSNNPADKAKPAAAVQPAAPAAKKEDNTTEISEKLRADLQPIVAKGIENIFSEIFKVKIVSNELVSSGLATEMVCVGRLHQKNVTIMLRFFFDQGLLKPLLRQLYSPEFLTDNKVYEDAACEIVNILCAQVKAFLNQHGYQLELDLPTMGVMSDADKKHPIMNIHFMLNEEQCFLVDLSTNANNG